MYHPEDAIVWEWLDEYQRWRPYSAEVSNFLQNSYEHLKSGNGSSTVVPPRLRVYTIDLNNMVQTRMQTGTKRNVRQKVYRHDGAVVKGRVWSFESDKPGVFQTYDFEVAEILEDQYKQDKKSQMDLSMTPCSLPYNIDFKSMTQRRKETSRIRKIKREKKVLGYTKAKNVGSRNTPSAKSTGQSHLNGLSLGAVGGFGGGVYQQPVPMSQQVGGFVGGVYQPPVPMSQQNVFGVPIATTLPSNSIGTSFIPTIISKTSASTGPVTRSSVKKSGAINTISVPAGWHPPLIIPGLDASPQSSSQKKNKAKKKKVPTATLR